MPHPPHPPEKDGPIPNAERSHRTRRLLLDAGRDLFTEQGYIQTSVEEIIRRAGVTNGALYYHFQDKAALFAAVFEDVRTTWIDTLRRVIHSAEGDLWQRVVVTSCRAFVESAADPSIHRIVYVDGPAVLPWAVRQKRAPGVELLREVFTQLIEAGLIAPLPLEPVAYLFWGAFFEAGMYVSAAEERETAERETTAAMIRFFTGLRLPQARGGRPT